MFCLLYYVLVGETKICRAIGQNNSNTKRSQTVYNALKVHLDCDSHLLHGNMQKEQTKRQKKMLPNPVGFDDSRKDS